MEHDNYYLMHLNLIEYIEKNYEHYGIPLKALWKKWQTDVKYKYPPSFNVICNWLFKGYLEYRYDRFLESKERRTQMVKNWKQMIAKPVEIRHQEHNMEEYGHWEIDLIVGSNKHYGYLITILERKSRFTFTTRINVKNPQLINEKLYELIEKFHPKMFKSITADNGLEFNNLWELANKFKIDVYYSFPYFNEKCNLNANWNRTLRQFFPKNIDFTKISIDELEYVTSLINTMPRKMLGWRSSDDVFKLHFGQINFNKMTKDLLLN